MSLPASTVSPAEDVTIVVHDLGGTGPLLLLAHATGFHARVWRPCAAHLRDFHCFAPDLRGHGDSTVPEGLGYEWSGFADDILAVVDHLRERDPDVDGRGLLAAGHSKGGASLLLAEQRRPGTFRSLYLYEPVVFPVVAEVPANQNPLAVGALRRRETFDSFDAAYDNFRSKPPFDALHPDALRAYVDHGFSPEADGTVRLKCRPATESAVYTMGARHGAYDHLEEVTCPVTVAIGTEESFGPARFAEAIVARLPHGRLERHPDLGHFGPLEAPETIARCIRAAFAGG